MEVEDHFGIKIPDVAVRFKTLGDMVDCVCEILKAKEGEDGWATRAFEQTRELLARIGGVDPKTIELNTPVSQILSGGWIYWKWRKVRKEIAGLRDLELPRWADRLFRWFAWIWFGVALGGMIMANGVTRAFWVVWLFGMPPVLLVLLLALWVGFAGIPKKYETAGQLAKARIRSWLVETRKPGEWTREDVWRIIQNRVSIVWSIQEDQLKPQTTFKELG